MPRDEVTIEVVLPRKRRRAANEDGITGRLPRISRLMALAIKCQGLIERRVLRDYSELARLGRISRARATQIMHLLQLAPDIQECLFVPAGHNPNRDPITERQLRCVVSVVAWEEQRKLFARLFGPDLLGRRGG